MMILISSIPFRVRSPRMVLMMIVMVSLITSCNVERKKSSVYDMETQGIFETDSFDFEAHSMVMMGRVYIQLKV